MKTPPKQPFGMLHGLFCLVSCMLAFAYWKSCSTTKTRSATRNSRSVNATVSWDYITLRMSTTSDPSTLPAFFFMAQGEEGGGIYSGFNITGGRGTPNPFHPKTSCPDDVFENTMDDMRVPQLPWRLQDEWGCEREPQNVSVLVLENEYLKATITPQYGGKIWSLYHKKLERHLFYNNPAHQPANIGYRKAWTSGGCEWNWGPGHIGHSVFTESPVWTAVLESEWGPVVRVYEYDRQNSTVWQVDMLLYEDTLLVHPKITNPNEHSVDGYWWTCVAMSVDGPNNRILSPASMSIGNTGKCSPWPSGAYTLDNTSFHGIDVRGCANDQTCAWQGDMSFLGNIRGAHDFFFRIPENESNHWIAQVQEDGLTVIHSHPSFLNGTKFFQWGYGEVGLFNQDFLAATDTENNCTSNAYDPYCMPEHPGLYTELQVGPARTQMHTFPLEASSTIEWTEWFKAWHANKNEMQDQDYTVALSAVRKWWSGKDGITNDFIENADAILTHIADLAPTKSQIVASGMPWGGLYEMVKQRDDPEFSLAPGCLFPETTITDETKPWLELLRTGTFSVETLSEIPVNFEVGDHWIAMLQASVQAGNATWLHYLYLGTHALEVGNIIGAREHFALSLKLKPSVHALRNLAIIANTKDRVVALFLQAWETWENLPDIENVAKIGSDLSSEMIGWLLVNKRWDDLEQFLDRMNQSSRSQPFLKRDAALHGRAALDVYHGDYDEAISTLRNNCFPTYGVLRIDLLDLWWQANKQKAIAAKDGIPLTTKEMLELRRELRCDGDVSDLGVDDTCICGPPNIGYAY